MTEQTKSRYMLVIEAVRNWFHLSFSGCEKVLCYASSVLIALVVSAEFAGLYWPSPVGYGVTAALAFGAAQVVFGLGQKLLRRCLGHGLGWLMAFIGGACAICFTVKSGAGEGWSWRVYVTGAVTLLIFWAAIASVVSWIRRGPKLTTVLCGVFFTAASAVLLVFFSVDGFQDSSMEDYLALIDHEKQYVSALDPSLRTGPFAVSVMDYGPGTEMETKPVDISGYAVRGDSLTHTYVDAYMEYDLSEVPVRGRIWYPVESENCPILFIAHGNHEITTESYLGYGYLGEYLASHGYVVVSVDQNACNMLSHENDARAVLLLEHIGLILDRSAKAGDPLYGLVDRDNIAIAGHSRGGEMVATAYLFNGYDHYPENGIIRFNYDYNIRALIAIAPTVNQYKPADHSVAIEDVNYLLLHGAADRDVKDFMGMSQYENISFTGQGDYIKSALYIAGANHAHFNSLWGENDFSGAGAALLNTESLLPQEEQQQLACIFIKVYLDVTLRGDESCRTLLTDWEDYTAQLPETVYVQCHEESGFRVIADFEEDSEVETATMEGAELYASGVNWWTEDLMDFAGQTAFDTHALRLRWSDRASYTLRFPQMDLRGSAVTFDICDLDSDAVEEGEYDLLDAMISIKDGRGVSAVARLSDFATVYPILFVKTDKLDYIFDTPTAKEAFATVSIPAEAFASDGDEIDLSDIREIRIAFSEGGEVALDNIGITPL